MHLTPVLISYGAAFRDIRCEPLASAGFSGAAVWRGVDLAGRPRIALKAYPSDAMTVERLATIHGWLRAGAKHPFVPKLLLTSDGKSFESLQGRLWEATEWMPGRADFHAFPSQRRLEAACSTLAELHREWKSNVTELAPAPAVQRRLRVLHDFHHMKAGTAWSVPVPLADTLRRGRELVQNMLPFATRALQAWTSRPLPLQPCLCDVWHDHVLFRGDEVTGIIDYGSMKIDHIAVDLARLLGSLVPEDDRALNMGLQAYVQAGGILNTPPEFTRMLAKTGLVCSVAVWCLRVQRPTVNTADVANRLAGLVAQLERLSLSDVL